MSRQPPSSEGSVAYVLGRPAGHTDYGEAHECSLPVPERSQLCRARRGLLCFRGASEAIMKTYFWAVAFLLLASSGALADSLTEKFRSNGCEVEGKFDDGKVESKVECQPRR